MATDAHSEVTVAISVVDKATPAIESVKESLKGIETVQQQINETAAKMETSLPRSLAEVRAAAEAHGGNIWNLPVRGAEAVSDVPAAAQDAVDQTNTIFQQLQASAQQTWEAIRRGFSGAFEWIAGAAAKIAGRIGAAFEGPLGFLAGFGFTTVWDAAATGMQRLVDTVDKLGPAAKNIGVSIGEFQRLSEWAKEGGVPVATMTRSLEDLTKKIGAINSGMKGPGVKLAGEALDALKFSEEDIAGIKNVYDFLPELSKRLAEMSDPGQRAAVAAALLGSSWKAMLPLLMQGPDALAAAAETSKKAGEIGPNVEKAVEDYKRALEGLRTSYEAFQTSLGAALVPAITPVLKDLTTFVQENGPGIAKLFQDIVSGVEKLYQVAQALQKIADGINAINDAFGKAGDWVHSKLFGGSAEGTASTPGATQVFPTWTPGGIIQPSAPSAGGGPISFEDLAGARGGLAGAPPSGTVNVVIQNKNPQPGQQVSATATGQGVKTQVDRGVSMPWAEPPPYAGPYAPAGG